MRYDTKQIAAAISKAVKAAQEYVNADDGGTCNFDTAYIRVPAMRETQAKQIEQICGSRLSLSNSSWHGRMLQIHCGAGQGNRNTMMAEAACKSLKESGLDAAVFYMMD